MAKGFRVTVVDLESGETGEKIVAPGDYILIPFAPCRLDTTAWNKNGTIQLTIKGHAPQVVEDSDHG